VNLKLVLGERLLFDLELPEVGPGGEVSAPPPTLNDRDLERLSSLYAIGSNAKRLKVMVELARGGELRFSDVMQIALNPKIAQDCLQPMVREGLVVHGERGSTYRVSEKALPLVTILTAGLAKLLPDIEEESGDGEGGSG
jgi:hypothetical protein